MNAETFVLARGELGRTRRQLALRLALSVLAALAVAGLLALLASLFLAAPAPQPVRAPFGLGTREAAPSPSGLGAFLSAMQGHFYKSLQGAVLALEESGAALWTLTGIGFAYGIFHAAGPGHGKAVIAAYLVASERTLVKGFSLSLAAALIQALVAIAVVGAAGIVMKATAASMTRLSNGVELASFLLVAALGALITWRKAGQMLGVAAAARDPLARPTAGGCDHAHLPPPEALDRMRSVREFASVALAAGLRPCAGALVVLVFALSQGVFAAGIAATFAMALGTALTTGAIATLAVCAKSVALRLAGGRGAYAALAVAGLELLAAAFVLVIGLALLLGLWNMR